MRVLISIVFILIITASALKAQEVIELYSGIVPNSKENNIKEEYKSGMYSGVTKPALEVYLPEKENSSGAAIIIIPGGSYGVVVYQGEGVKTAKEFARNGVAAFVLKYRLPNDSIMADKKIGPLQDALQAIKIVRENSSKWGIDINKIGIMGFSAGGHLASTVATHFDQPVIENQNNTNLRPDFQILIYPVISMQDSLTHADSRKNLLGINPSKELVDEFSNELQVKGNTPPAYITHAGDDKVVVVDNSIAYYEALKRHNVPAEMHIYPKGNHGFVLFRPVDDWVQPILKWMKNSKWMNN